MGTLSVRIPDSIHNEVKKLSKSDNVSINQFIASALSEKITALETETYISQRAKLGEKSKFLAVLAKVPNNEPLLEDK
jgi:hypothetical protein